MKKIALSLIFAAAAVALHAQFETEIEVAKNEKWWGIYISGSPSQPFTLPFSIDTSIPSDRYNTVSFMVSNSGRYIWSANPFEVVWDGRTIVMRSDYEKVGYSKAGRSLREAYLVGCHENFPPSGRMPDVSLFTMPVYQTEFEFGRGQSQQAVEQYAGKLIEEGFPAGIMVIADGWQSVNGPYAFDRDLYPDPKAMLDKLHALGFKVMLTVTPFIPMYGRNYVEALRSGQLMSQLPGITDEIYRMDGTYSAIRNLGTEEQFRIISQGMEKIRASLPVDGFRFDDDNALSGWNGELVKQHRANWYSLGEGAFPADYSAPATSAFPPYVSGTYPQADLRQEEVIASAINNVILSGLAGRPFTHVCPYLAMLPTGPGDDHFKSGWLQMQAGMPVAYVDFAPWRIADRKLYNTAKDALNFRASIAGWVASLVAECAKTGEPVVRHMEYHFPRQGFTDCIDQFMLGGRYMFAPCRGEEGGRRNVRLPRGNWTNLNGQRFKGPVVIEADCTDFRSSVFQLEGK